MDKQILQKKIQAIDGQDYGACQSLRGGYDYGLFRLIVQQIPKDPYAPPHTGIYRVQLSRSDARIINRELQSGIQQRAFTDYLARHFHRACEQHCAGQRGTGYSGLISINEPGQAVLSRNCVVISDELIEVRCFIGLPAEGRKVVAKVALTMLLEELPRIVEQALLRENIDEQALQGHIDCVEDAGFLRKSLEGRGLVAFIADGSLLPRASGTSDRPLESEGVIPFHAPDELAVELELPHAGRIRGMGVKKGVTLIVGGGYHGKSTLLNTLEAGVYDHVPGDGREYCVAHPLTLKLRAYSGRSVVKTDISSFINGLPFGQDTHAFSSSNASGSTSQAANIVEGIEAGARVLLMDEDTCATNFMSRDLLMQQLVHKADEPITTFIDRVRQLYEQRGISTVLVLGGVGDYFAVSDEVIQMIDYVPHDVTAQAHAIMTGSPVQRQSEAEAGPLVITERIPLLDSIQPYNRYGKFAVYAKEVQRLTFGAQLVDLTDLEQLVELSQTRALACAMDYAKRYMDGQTCLYEVAMRVEEDIEANGLDVLSERMSGHFALFRALELALAFNRLRGFEVLQKEGE